MDLILLQPGDPSFFENLHGGQPGGTLIDQIPAAGNTGLIPGQCIELVSVNQGIAHHSESHPVISELTCVKYVDPVSVKMYDYCLRAQLLGKGSEQPTRIYILRNSGDQQAIILTVELRDAMITEIQFQTTPNDMPTEQFKLNFSEITWKYSSEEMKGPPKPVKAGWSLGKQKPIKEFTK